MTPDELRAACSEHGIPVTITGFVREADAARLCDVSVRTLRDWRRSGVGPPAVRMGGWRYSLEGLAAAHTAPAESDEIRQGPADCDSDPAAHEPHSVLVKKSQVA